MAGNNRGGAAGRGGMREVEPGISAIGKPYVYLLIIVCCIIKRRGGRLGDFAR